MNHNEAVTRLVEAVTCWHAWYVRTPASSFEQQKTESEIHRVLSAAYDALATAEKCCECDRERRRHEAHLFCGTCGRPFDAPEKEHNTPHDGCMCPFCEPYTRKSRKATPAIEPLKVVVHCWSLEACVNFVSELQKKINELIASHNKHINGGGM